MVFTIGFDSKAHGHLGMSGKGKDPAPFSAPGAVHRGVGHASMAEESPLVGRSMEHEGIVDKLHRRQFRISVWKRQVISRPQETCKNAFAEQTRRSRLVTGMSAMGRAPLAHH